MYMHMPDKAPEEKSLPYSFTNIFIILISIGCGNHYFYLFKKHWGNFLRWRLGRSSLIPLPENTNSHTGAKKGNRVTQ